LDSPFAAFKASVRTQAETDNPARSAASRIAAFSSGDTLASIVSFLIPAHCRYFAGIVKGKIPCAV